jgi:energy-coupling factor transporter ATP-binding protein EcfA2
LNTLRLKKLELYGFKSFAQRTEIVFDEGITGIVGPNGSGKSNIGDAVRWVLGEQSAKTLRGASMSDVIFNGTQKRKPLSYCEVSLIFDNEDGQLPMQNAEVMVTRRVYRNGESEYFLNRAACRLRDIIDLFRNEQVRQFEVDEENNLSMIVRAALPDGTEGEGFVTYKLRDINLFINDLGELIEVQHEEGIISAYDYPPPYNIPWWVSLIPYAIVIVLLIAMWMFVMNQATGGKGSKINSVGRAKAKLVTADKAKV